MAMLELKQIYEMYKQDVFHYLLSLTHDHILSEDLTSETFLSALKSLPSFRGESDIKTWLFSIARYRWFGYLRKRKEDLTFNELTENYLRDTMDLQEMVVNKHQGEMILSLLEKESERTKDIVLMRIDGYSFYEISTKHSISESSARVIDFRAKKKIREFLEKEEANHE
ncbi:MAG: RNA polymerase sigma factor [Clostridium sp.]|nr:RNA polymerase sigma factor [Clostridium sp.]